MFNLPPPYRAVFEQKERAPDGLRRRCFRGASQRIRLKALRLAIFRILVADRCFACLLALRVL